MIFLFLLHQKRVRRSQHARKETEFLRLKRTRLGLEDFESLKVIGRGAFGEVGGCLSLVTTDHNNISLSNKSTFYREAKLFWVNDICLRITFGSFTWILYSIILGLSDQYGHLSFEFPIVGESASVVAVVKRAAM